jgi:Na+/H+ antiporter NhaA
MTFKLSALLQPFEDFFKRQASDGLVLIGATLPAMVLANSPAEPSPMSAGSLILPTRRHYPPRQSI